jgi:hypothetical protein
MSFINNFAFFWIGSDISIPSYLTKTIVHAYKGEKVNIFMLTDKKTPYINGVSKTIRSELPKDIMLARLKAYSKLKIDDQVIFLDADSLVLNKFKKISTEKKFVVFRRNIKGIKINHNHPEFYPEFIGKTPEEIMPFMFGAIVTSSKDSYKNFLTILEEAKKLPSRFHRWYGDQYALKLVLEKNLIDFDEKIFTDYISIVRKEVDLKNINKEIVTFQGSQSKEYIKIIYLKVIENTDVMVSDI